MKKLNLNTISLTSFVTHMDQEQATVKGGITQNECSCTACAPDVCALSYECGVPTMGHTCYFGQD